MGSADLNIELSPRHLQLREMLFRRWKTNGVRIGDKIESQNEIVKFCDFSLITVIKTLKDLEAEGVIRRQVGKGSFLVEAPWTESHHRIGFFYNRDIVGGGIFNNDFYTKLVVAFEKGVVSDGHEFILGSFTHKSMPIHLWDALDVVVLTGITKQTDIGKLPETSSQIAIMDLVLEGLPCHAYRLDFEPAFQAMFRRNESAKLKYLYLNSAIPSSEQASRLAAFKRACAACATPQELRVISVNQESGDADKLESVLASYKPDIVGGYVHHSWLPMIAGSGAKVYPYALDSSRSSFTVNSSEWMQSVLSDLYSNLEERRPEAKILSFPATFRP
jgi:hypothetical protein